MAGASLVRRQVCALLGLTALLPLAIVGEKSFWDGSICTDISVFLQHFNNTAPAMAFSSFPQLFEYMKRLPPYTPLPLRLALSSGHQLGYRTVDLFIRTGTSDFSVMVQHFCTCDFCELPAKLDLVANHVHSIIDLGGNVGAAALAMAMVFPRARVITVEPGSSTYHVLHSNTAHHPRIISLYGAAWPRTTFLTFHGSIYGNATQAIHDWATSVGPVESSIAKAEEIVPAYSIDFIIDKFSAGGTVDVLKIDIEGSEVELFHSSGHNPPTWLHAVRCLVVEWHGHEATKAHYEKFHAYMGAYGFKQLPVFGEHEAWCRKMPMARHASSGPL